MRPTPIAIGLLLGAVFTGTGACRRQSATSDDARAADAGGPVDLYNAICDGRRICDDFDTRQPEHFGDVVVGITDCVRKSAVNLYGFWSVADAESRPFEWKAEVRRGGVFPSLHAPAVGLGCVDYGPNLPFPGAIVALDPPGFAWAKLEGDDVFVPLHGEATLDHDFHARATLDPRGDASELRVTVSLESSAAPMVYRGLGRADTFPWGRYRATVVRLVEPQDGVLGAVGWVEVKLSDTSRNVAEP